MGSGAPVEWAVFAIVVTGLLLLDLGVFGRRDPGVRQALGQTLFSIAVALGFGFWIWWRDHWAHERASLFLTGYVLEEALSIDNLFVFLVVFGFFQVKPKAQRRALLWGILGAMVFRGLMIFAGTSLADRFDWVFYVFGVVLLYSAWHLVVSVGEPTVDPSKNRALKLFRRWVPISADYAGARFFTVENGRRLATPLLAVLVVIETTDVLFAMDSVPAVIGVTTDKFVVYTSNVFAIAALRSMFFAISALMGKIRYLNVGLAGILAFIGLKMIAQGPIERAIGHDLPVWLSLVVIAAFLAIAVIASLLNPQRPKDDDTTGAKPAAASRASGDS